jgi:hypothetical protein
LSLANQFLLYPLFEKPMIVGSRGSPLALRQTRLVVAELKREWTGRNFEIHVIKTEGRPAGEPFPARSGTGQASFHRGIGADVIEAGNRDPHPGFWQFSNYLTVARKVTQS